MSIPIIDTISFYDIASPIFNEKVSPAVVLLAGGSATAAISIDKSLSRGFVFKINSTRSSNVVHGSAGLWAEVFHRRLSQRILFL
jgi:hypothetical protein